MRTPRRQALAFAWLYCVAVFALAACSLKTLYNHLDIFVADYVSDMVTLDDMLSRRVDTESIALIDWHRSTQLNDYADWFDAMHQDLQAGVKRQQVLAHFERLETFWRAIVDKAFYEAAALIPLLDKQQQQELFENINIKNAAFYQKYVDLNDEERVAQYIERIEDSLEPWLDDLSDAQQQLIAETAAGLKPLAAARFSERQRWQLQLARIVEREQPAAIKTEQLREFFKRFSQSKDAKIDADKAFNKQLLADFMMKLLASLDPEQKQYLESQLTDYAQTFRELAAEQI